MSRRRIEGGETWSRLREWTRGQAASERLAAQLLRVEGFSSIDPSHPLGGQDGLKDVICLRDKIRWVGAAYFPRGQQSFGEIADKFNDDLGGVTANEASGFAFVTNQELRLGERKQLRESVDDIEFELLHLERIASILDSPQCYGIRLEFLDIEMTKEEQLAFIAARDEVIERLQHTLDRIVLHLQSSILLSNLPIEQIRESIPLTDIQRFKEILDTIAGSDPYRFTASGFFPKPGHIGDLRVPLEELKEYAGLLDRIAGNRDLLGGMTGIAGILELGHTRNLRVPLEELKEFANILDHIAGNRDLLSSVAGTAGILQPGHVRNLRVPLEELKEFATLLDRIAGNRDLLNGVTSLGTLLSPGHVRDLHVPIDKLQKYETILDRIIEKLKEKDQLEHNLRSGSGMEKAA